MSRFYAVLMSCAFTLLGLSSASAQAYVAAITGNNTNSATGCHINAPCADLNTALSVISAGGNIIFLEPGTFGPIRLTAQVGIGGFSPDTAIAITGNPSALVGCIGGAPGSCGANSGFGVEIAAGVNDSVRIQHMQIGAGSGSGGLKFTSGGTILLAHIISRGNGAATGPIILLNPNNPGTTQAQVYFADSDVGFNNSGANAGAVLVQPQGNTSMELHFNHVQVHNASYGIRTDGSSLSGPSGVVATFVSESEFFSFNNAAVNAFSTAGTGTVNAIFKDCDILNASVALKANGPQSFVVLTRNTVGGNGTGVQVLNGATVLTSLDNTITGNGPSNNQNVSGTLTAAPLQ